MPHVTGVGKLQLCDLILKVTAQKAEIISAGFKPATLSHERGEFLRREADAGELVPLTVSFASRRCKYGDLVIPKVMLSEAGALEILLSLSNLPTTR